MPRPSDLRLVDVGKTFGRHKVLRHVDLDIPAGSFVALMGANGAGKTTLLRLVAGLATPTTGAVTLAGVDLRKAGPGLRRMLGFVSHDGLLYGDLTGRQNLMFHARMFGVADPEARIEELADVLDLRRVLDRPAGVLSRGNKQRLTLARALMHGPDVLLLDEPFTGLDEESSTRLVAAAHRAARRGPHDHHDRPRDVARPRGPDPPRGDRRGRHRRRRADRGAGRRRGARVACSSAPAPTGSHAAYAPSPAPGCRSGPTSTSRTWPRSPRVPRSSSRRGRFRSAGMITMKDLRVELRSRDVLMSSGLFAVTVLITASFTTVQSGNTGSMATGILWISLLFAVLLGVGRSMARESQDRAIEGLLLSPAPRDSIFLGKLAAGLVTMGLIELFIVPMFLVLMTGESQGSLDVGGLVLAVVLATIGLTIVATLFSGIAVGSRMGESLLPLIVMPVVIPLMIAAVETTRQALGGDTAGSVSMVQWYALLAGFDLVVGLAAIATFSFVVEDS